MKLIKKTLSVLILIFAVLVLSSACSNSKPTYRDGVYTAQSPQFAGSGWKDTMELTVQGGKIVKINWDAIYKDDSIPIRKKQYSKSGLYGMMAGGAAAEWYDQAVAIEQFVLEHGIEELSYNEGGYTDAVSGCTVHVSEFDKLVKECLEQAKK